MIQDSDIEQALEYLQGSATKAAKARAERIYVEQYLKHLEASLMKEHAHLAVNGQEREARSDQRYEQHLKAIKEAVYLDEYHRFMRDAASAKIQAWQTMSANNRGSFR